MKITAIALLLASTQAIKLHQKASMKTHLKVKGCPTAEEEEEIGAAIEHELAADGGISKDDVMKYMPEASDE